MTWELTVLEALRAWGHPGIDAMMAALSVLAPFLTVGAVAYLAQQGRRRQAWVLLAAVVGAVLLSVELQYILLRPRPEIAGILPTIPTPSFPSGHAAMSAALATFMVFAGSRRAKVITIGFAAAVMLSRVWLGHHYPVDVLVGAVVGTSVSALLFGAYLAEHGARPRWAWWIWPQASVVVLASASAYLGLSTFEWLRIPGADKVLHFLLFGLLSFFVVGWLARYRARWVIAALLVASFADELLQAWSPSRTFDLGDLVCTVAGVLSFGIAAAVMLRRRVPGAQAVLQAGAGARDAASRPA